MSDLLNPYVGWLLARAALEPGFRIRLPEFVGGNQSTISTVNSK